MAGGFDRRKSLQEIELDDWGEPTFDSHLVTTVHRLRRKPLAEFTEEDLRLMIGQQISLPILMPLAIARLEEEPLAQGHFYRGDLLAAVSRVDEVFWSSHPGSLQRVREVAGRVRELLPALDEPDRQTIADVLANSPRSVTG